MLKIGDRMTSFEVRDQDGNTVKSEDFIGRKTIIYFYPKDNSSGCTAEAYSIRDNYEALKAAGGEKKMYGKTVLGMLRRTFIFDEKGILARIIEKVDTKNAAAQILQD